MLTMHRTAQALHMAVCVVSEHDHEALQAQVAKSLCTSLEQVDSNKANKAATQVTQADV